LNIDPKEARIAIQGFGNVGSFTAKFLDEMGYKVVAINDASACIYDPNGLDIPKIMEELKLLRTKMKAPVLNDLNDVPKEPRDKIFEKEADIFIPAATSYTINEQTVHHLISSKVKMVVEAANIPTTKGAERILQQNGVWIIPDFLVNAGGVIGSYVEYIGGTEMQAFELIKYKITTNVKRVLIEAANSNNPPRIVAEDVAKRRVKKAMLLREGAIDVATEAYAREDLEEYMWRVDGL
jgi:glutamate dehydrogenase (NAD(P)+)